MKLQKPSKKLKIDKSKSSSTKGEDELKNASIFDKSNEEEKNDDWPSSSSEDEEEKSSKILKEEEDDMNINLISNIENATSSSFDKPTKDITSIKEKISEKILILQNLKKFQNSGNSIKRKEILEKLTEDVSMFYQFSFELANYFMKMFKPEEAISFFDACDVRCPITIRTNLLKTKRRDLAQVLISRGVNVDPVGDWSKVGLKVYDASVPVGATPEYLAGHYLIQSASSFIPVIALAPQPGEKVLDMAAAPGGKSTYIGQLMKNTGCLFANDVNRERCNALVANLHRLGVTNSVVTNMDGRKLKEYMPRMDRILLDAPCSGLGIISRDPSVKIKRGVKDMLSNSVIQKELLAHAVDMVDATSKTGGYIVYSTCSISVEENEAVINHILKVRDVKLVPLGVDFGVPAFKAFQELRFHPSIALHARRYYPHVHNLDGFFVAKLKKLSDTLPARIRKDRRKQMGDAVQIWGEEKWTDEYLETTAAFDDTEDEEEAAPIIPKVSKIEINAKEKRVQPTVRNGKRQLTSEVTMREKSSKNEEIRNKLKLTKCIKKSKNK